GPRNAPGSPSTCRTPRPRSLFFLKQKTAYEIARRVEDVLVEELRGYEDRLRGVEPADEAVHVEAGGEVEGVALQHAALHRSPARQVEEAGVDEGIEAALGVVLLLEAAGRGRARRAGRIGARPPPLAVHGLALEVGRLG